jgi:hypothetical protein
VGCYKPSRGIDISTISAQTMLSSRNVHTTNPHALHRCNSPTQPQCPAAVLSHRIQVFRGACATCRRHKQQCQLVQYTSEHMLKDFALTIKYPPTELRESYNDISQSSNLQPQAAIGLVASNPKNVTGTHQNIPTLHPQPPTCYPWCGPAPATVACVPLSSNEEQSELSKTSLNR